MALDPSSGFCICFLFMFLFCHTCKTVRTSPPPLMGGWRLIRCLVAYRAFYLAFFPSKPLPRHKRVTLYFFVQLCNSSCQQFTHTHESVYFVLIPAFFSLFQSGGRFSKLIGKKFFENHQEKCLCLPFGILALAVKPLGRETEGFPFAFGERSERGECVFAHRLLKLARICCDVERRLGQRLLP